MAVIDRSEIAPEVVIPRQRAVRSWGDLLTQAVSYLLLSLGGLSMLVPFLWMIGTSLKPAGEIYQPTFFPNAPTLANYQEVIFRTAFPHWYLNSLIVAIISTTSVAFFDTLAGYTFSKFDFPLKNVMFILILSTLMVPTEMLIIPWYIMSVNFNWVDTYWGIAFPGVITASGVFLMRQFMTGVPNELLDAARIDGLWEFGIFYKIAVPLVKPAIAALCIFNFLGNWNAFIWPLIVTSKRLTMTLPVGLSFFSGEAGSDWHLIMTGATLSVIPLMTVVILFQRQIIRGIALTGLKA